MATSETTRTAADDPPEVSPTPARVPRLRRTRTVGTYARVIFWKAGDDRALGLAAEIAFFGFLSVFPGLLLLAALLGSLGTIVGTDLAQRAESSVLDFLNRVLTERAAGAIDSVADLFSEDQGGAITVAAIAALFALSGAFGAVISALNVVYGCAETRNFVVRRIWGLALAVGTSLVGTVVIAIVVVGPLLGSGTGVLEDFGAVQAYESTSRLLRWPVLFAALVVWATTMCHVAPAQRTRWLVDLPGGFFTAALWLVSSLAFSAYLGWVPAANPIFGALGGGLTLMVWFYLMSLSLLLGAELNSVFQRRRVAQST